MKKINNPLYKLAVTAFLLIFAAALYLLPISCPILSLTGIPCLGCGMTRALLSAVTLDFKAAFSYHIMFWAVPLMYICFLFDGRLFKSSLLNRIFYIILAVGFAANWVIHVFF